MDALRVAPLALLCLVPIVPYLTYAPEGSLPPLDAPVYAVLTLALLLPLLWRHRPLTAFAVVSLVSFAQWVAQVEVVPANLSVLVALWAVVYQCAFRWALAALAVAELGVFLALEQWDTPTLGMFTTSTIFVMAL